ncbi:hypothetical protein NE237_031065 [Protea cynaroides]|uniref:Uncharacterized protein n=1 Tax=Protea cynaroides TaxID=273540 RepID=A0A9Q0GL98_9MAGN|nr:hypothetical protein NE237_031065 [Protea cynaroides]
MEIMGRVPEARVPLSMVFIGGVMRSYAMIFTASRTSPAEVGVQENEDDGLVGLTKGLAHGVMVSMATTLVIGSSGKLLYEKEDDAPRFFQLVVQAGSMDFKHSSWTLLNQGATTQQSRFSDSLEMRPQMRGVILVLSHVRIMFVTGGVIQITGVGILQMGSETSREVKGHCSMPPPAPPSPPSAYLLLLLYIAASSSISTFCILVAAAIYGHLSSALSPSPSSSPYSPSDRVRRRPAPSPPSDCRCYRSSGGFLVAASVASVVQSQHKRAHFQGI